MKTLIVTHPRHYEMEVSPVAIDRMDDSFVGCFQTWFKDNPHVISDVTFFGKTESEVMERVFEFLNGK